MPTNRIYVPHLNPVKYFKVSPDQLPQYLSRHMDDWQFRNTIREFEQEVEFFQPWGQEDSFRQQFISNFSPLTLRILNCHGQLMYEQELETRQQHFQLAGYYIRQSEVDFGSLGLDDGLYYFQIPELDWISNPQELSQDPENTLYLEYRSSKNYYEGVIFGSPITLSIRVPGILKYKQPGSTDTLFVDQTEAETMLNSVPFRVWRFILGGIGGVPPDFVDKVARISGCDDFKIDGRNYTKAQGANWDVSEVDGYPMAGYGIDLRELLNRNSLVYDNDVNILGKAAMISVVDKKYFGIEDNGNDFLEIVDGG